MRVITRSVVWHELECGSYTADLPLWRTLAEDRPGPVLEIGAGTGRVALDLARAGHQVTALDNDQDVLGELRRHADQAGLAVSVALADARDFRLEDRRFGLVLVPMQTIQLLDRPGRAGLLRCVLDHLQPGGRMAAAITERFDLYDAQGEDAGRLPPPDVQETGGTVYVSQPTAVRQAAEGYILERRREVLRPDGTRDMELGQERLHALSAAELEREGAAAGLRPAGPAVIPATSDHVGSTVVMFDA